MSTTKRERNHQPAGRTMPQPPESAITDEHLGLLPAGDDDRVSDVIGPDQDDLELQENEQFTFAPRDTAAGDDFKEAGRQAQAEIIADETDLSTTPHLLGEAEGTQAAVEPSWTERPLITDPAAAVGDPDDAADPVSDLDETYTPPTDPVVTTRASGEVEILGGFSASGGEEIAPLRSSDGQIGDEALADAVRAALRLDAATTDLQIHVTAAQGVIRLRGSVPDLDDADNAESIAAGVEGVLEVQEQLDVVNG